MAPYPNAVAAPKIVRGSGTGTISPALAETDKLGTVMTRSPNERYSSKLTVTPRSGRFPIASFTGVRTVCLLVKVIGTLVKIPRTGGSPPTGPDNSLASVFKLIPLMNAAVDGVGVKVKLKSIKSSGLAAISPRGVAVRVAAFALIGIRAAQAVIAKLTDSISRNMIALPSIVFQKFTTI
jgi:hypothetical protein